MKTHSIIKKFYKLRLDVSYYGNIYLGGSAVLYHNNLIDRSPKDMDILCSVRDTSLIRMFKILSKTNPVNNQHYGSYNSTQMEGCIEHIRFKLKDIDVCVFVTEEDLLRKISKWDGTIDVDHILKAKEFYLSKLPENHKSFIKHTTDINQAKRRLNIN